MFKSVLRFVSIAIGAGLSCASVSLANEVNTQDDLCAFEDMPRAQRQTILVIDSSVVFSENSGGELLSENNGWRDFVRQFVDARGSDIASRLDPRERVTVMIANAGGAGATQVYSGCIPVFSVEENATMAAMDTSFGKFFGSSWAKQHEEMSKSVARSAQIGMVEAAKSVAQTDTERTEFAESGLVKSLRRAQSTDLVSGVPRIFLYTDLSRYNFPEGSVAGLRGTAFADAKDTDLSLGRAEMHLVSVSEAESSGAEHYLKAFFLGSGANLTSQSAAKGRMHPSYPVADVAVFSGSISFGELGDFPVRMRLVRDVNGTTTNSWFEEVGEDRAFVPVEGQLSCEGVTCKFTQTNDFAQVWAADPSSDLPECGDQIPFLGMRMLGFETDGDVLTGKIHDTVCYLPGFEDGIPFQLKAVENGRW
jgi:hypothetical protein